MATSEDWAKNQRGDLTAKKKKNQQNSLEINPEPSTIPIPCECRMYVNPVRVLTKLRRRCRHSPCNPLLITYLLVATTVASVLEYAPKREERKSHTRWNNDDNDQDGDADAEPDAHLHILS